MGFRRCWFVCEINMLFLTVLMLCRALVYDQFCSFYFTSVYVMYSKKGTNGLY